MMHNHGPAEGDGLSCNELLMPDGSRKGKCLLTPEELDGFRARRAEAPTLRTVAFDSAAEKVLYDFVGDIPAVRIHATESARARGRKVDLLDPTTIIKAAIGAKVLERDNLLRLVETAMAAGRAERG